MKKVKIISLSTMLCLLILSVSGNCTEVINMQPGVTPTPDSLNIASSIDFDTDRPGLDYKNFDLLKADFALCSRACADDSSCKAWTYVKPGLQKLNVARCWLKKGIPSAVKNTCCVSGVIARQPTTQRIEKIVKPEEKTLPGIIPQGIQPVPQLSAGMEADTDRPGMDYKNFYLSVSAPKFCQNACKEDPKTCKAWTYVKPGIQGKQARCWLKKGVPPKKTNTCCISGVM